MNAPLHWLSIGLLLALGISHPALGSAAENDAMPSEFQLPDGQLLQLNGSGYRTKLWLKIYLAGLYLQQPGQSLDQIMASPKSNAMVLKMTYKEVSQSNMTEAIIQGFEDNLGTEDMRLLKPRLDQFVGYFVDDAKENDRYTFIYRPASGTTVSKNEVKLGTVPGLDFNRALLNVWLGNSPVDRSLKQRLLNQ